MQQCRWNMLSARRDAMHHLDLNMQRKLSPIIRQGIKKSGAYFFIFIAQIDKVVALGGGKKKLLHVIKTFKTQKQLVGVYKTGWCSGAYLKPPPPPPPGSKSPWLSRSRAGKQLAVLTLDFRRFIFHVVGSVDSTVALKSGKT